MDRKPKTLAVDDEVGIRALIKEAFGPKVPEGKKVQHSISQFQKKTRSLD